MSTKSSKDTKNDSLALGLDNRFNRKPRWMSGMAVYLLQSNTASYQQQQAKKQHLHGKRPRSI